MPTWQATCLIVPLSCLSLLFALQESLKLPGCYRLQRCWATPQARTAHLIHGTQACPYLHLMSCASCLLPRCVALHGAWCSACQVIPHVRAQDC
jgi:hypothetical protein